MPRTLLWILPLILAASEARADEETVSFRTDVIAAISHAGCNSGACHGSPQGKNGFRLSLRGYDPRLDYTTLSREFGVRRVNRLEPEQSIILRKGSGAIDHQGGQRFTPDSLPYRILRDWVAEGLLPEPAGSQPVVSIQVTPQARLIDAPGREQQLVPVDQV